MRYRVLYLFAGKHRKNGSIGAYLKDYCRLLAKATGRKIDVVVREIDLLIDKERHDIVNDEVWDKITADLDRGEYDQQMVSPPCNSHTRALFKKDRGAKPLRNMQNPRGFPWLEGEKKAKVERANLLIDRTLEAIKRGKASSARTRWLGEHPEDLGSVGNEDPASIWQDPEWVKEATTSGALYQCRFPPHRYRKPTRIAGTMKRLRAFVHVGWPKKDKFNHYRGPLPRACGHNHDESAIGKDPETDDWRTGPLAEYPDEMSRGMAGVMIKD